LIGRASRSLTAKILIAFAVVVLVGIGGVAILANDRTTAAFEHYLRGNGPGVENQLGNVAAIVYGQGRSWETVSRVLIAMPGPQDQRVIIVDSSGQVVVDTLAARGGPATSTPSLSNGHPISVNGTIVGTLYQVSPFGGEGGPGSSFGRSPSGLSPSDRAFLAQVNQSLALAAVAASLVALVLGVLLARQIIRPLRQLTRVAQRIAHGHLDERISITGQDEVAQLGDAFNGMAESLQRTENARRQLVADVAHELRTPLMVVSATVEAMEDGVLPLDKPNLATIRDEVTSLRRLVADLRDLSLGDVGQFSLEHEPVDVAGVLDSVGSAFAPAAATRGINLSVDLDPELPWILGDETRLRQCARNLVENALRYTPAGGRVTVRGRAVDDSVWIEVIDTGEGIKAEHLTTIFERFFRADQSRNRRSGGSGLGLAIVQQIVRAQGGEVSVASRGPGQGATFTIRLPALRSSKAGEVASPVLEPTESSR
jgi:signal transduction histidine kinase